MTQRHDQQEFVFQRCDLHEVRAAGDLGRHRHDAQIERTGEHRFGDGSARRLSHGESDAGVLLAKLADNRWEQVAGRGRPASDGDRAPLKTGELADRTDAFLGATEDIVGVLKENATGAGQLNTLRGAVEELGPHFRFEALERRGQSRLRDAEALGRAGHVTLGGDRDEVTQRREFHR